jgi:ABC-type transport system substrate-binding protein
MARASLDTTERESLYKEIQEILVEDTAVIPIYYTLETAVTASVDTVLCYT